MSEALATLNNNSAALTQVAGLEDLGNNSVKIARMELVQRTSRAVDAQFGKFRDVLTGEHFDELKIVPLHVRKGRVLFAPGGDLNQPPICRSSDGVRPHKDVDTPQNDLCKGCSRSSWAGYNRKTKIGKPDCQEKWNVLFIKRDSYMPYFMSFGSTSLRFVREAIEGIKRDAIGVNTANEIKQRKGEIETYARLALYDYSISMKPTRVDGPKGSYYVVTFGLTSRLKPEDREIFGPMYEMFRTQRSADAEQSEQQANVEAVEEGFSEA